MQPKEKLEYACNTMPILVWGKNICMQLQKLVGSISFLKPAMGFAKMICT